MNQAVAPVCVSSHLCLTLLPGKQLVQDGLEKWTVSPEKERFKEWKVTGESGEATTVCLSGGMLRSQIYFEG